MKQGPLAGEVIPFLSNCTWLLGRHMGKADLSYVFVAGADNTVTVEALQNAQYEPGMPRYFASMVYNTFTRRPVEGSNEDGDFSVPRTWGKGKYARYKQNLRQGWLKQRKIDAAFFDKLANGEVASKSGPENSVPKETQLQERFSKLTRTNTDKMVKTKKNAQEIATINKYLPSKCMPRNPDTLKRNFGKVKGSFGKDSGKSPHPKKAKKTPEETTKSQIVSNKEAAFARRCAEQRAELEQESVTNPLRNKPVTARIVMGALSAKGPDDPSLKSLIRNSEDAEMATNLCKYLVAALEHYSQPSSQPGGNPSENQPHHSRPPQGLIHNYRPENQIGGHDDVHVNPNVTLTRNAHAPPGGEAAVLINAAAAAARSSAERHANEVSRLQHEAWQLRAEREREIERLHALELRLREDHGRRVRHQQRNERTRREECERAQRDNFGSGVFEREFQDR